MSDSPDALLRDLALTKAGWHRQENPETGAVAIFPETATNESEWEQRAKLQLAEAKSNLAIPEPKPMKNTLAARRTIARGD